VTYWRACQHSKIEVNLAGPFFSVKSTLRLPGVSSNGSRQRFANLAVPKPLGAYFEREADCPKLSKTLKTSSKGWSLWTILYEYEVHGKIVATGASYDNRFISVVTIDAFANSTIS
jgi:hypothetical protein